MPGSFTMCCWRVGRAELLDFWAELDTPTPKSLQLNNNMASCKFVKEFVSALHHSKPRDCGRRSVLVFRSQIIVRFRAVAVRFFASNPFRTDAIHLEFSVSEESLHHAQQLRANVALSVSEFRSPGKRNTCGLARGTNLFRGTAALYDVQFAILRLPADPQLDHCRDALEGKRNGSHPVRYLVVARVHWQQPARDTLKE